MRQTYRAVSRIRADKQKTEKDVGENVLFSQKHSSVLLKKTQWTELAMRKQSSTAQCLMIYKLHTEMFWFTHEKFCSGNIGAAAAFSPQFLTLCPVVCLRHATASLLRVTFEPIFAPTWESADRTTNVSVIELLFKRVQYDRAVI